MTRQSAAEFRKIETEMQRDKVTKAVWTFQDSLRWLSDPRNVGKRYGWTLSKTEAPKTD